MNDESSEYGNDVSEAEDEAPSTKTAASKKAALKAGKKAGKKAAVKAPAKAAKTRSAALRRQNAMGERDTESRTPVPSKTPVTEIPVPTPPRPKTSQYLITVDNSTGVPTKIEKVDSETGEKKELSKGESTRLVAAMAKPAASGVANLFAATPAAGPFAARNVSLSSPFQDTPNENPALTEAYYRGVADYLHAIGLA